MNTTFRLDGCHELEITSDGSTNSRDPNMSSGGALRGTVGVMLHYNNLFPPNADGSPAAGPSTNWTTKAAIVLKRNQARAIASALLNAVSDAADR